MVLAFDYPSSGASDGRSVASSIRSQQRGTRRDHVLDRRPDVDDSPSASGAPATGAATLTVGAVDRRVRCVVSQVPTISGSRSTLRRNTPESLRRTTPWDEDRLHRFRGGEPGLVKALADDNMFTRMPPECSVNLDTHVTLRTMEMYAEYEPASIIEQISPAAPDDHRRRRRHHVHRGRGRGLPRAREPKSLLIVPGDHRVYFEDSSEPAARRDWFMTHLLK